MIKVWLHFLMFAASFRPHSLHFFSEQRDESPMFFPSVPWGYSDHETPAWVWKPSVLSHVPPRRNPEPASNPSSLGSAWEACPVLPRYINHVSNKSSHTLFKWVWHHRSQCWNQILDEGPPYTCRMITANPKYNLLHNHSRIIKIRKLTLICLDYLTYKPFSDLFICPNNVPQAKDLGWYY